MRQEALIQPPGAYDRALDALLNLGVTPDLTPRQAHGVRLTNRVAVFVSVLLLPYLLTFVLSRSTVNAFIQVLGIGLLLSVPLLNRAGQRDTARALTLLVGNGLVCLMTTRLGVESGLPYYAFAAIVAPLFFYSTQEWQGVATFVSMTLLGVLAAYWWASVHGPASPVPTWFASAFHVMNLVGALVTTFAFVLYFYVESHRLEAALLRANAEVARLAETDVLTGVANRRMLERVLRAEWARAAAEGRPLSAVIVDVDHFKPYNDNYGHDAGDGVLARVAAAFRAELRRPGDLVGRYGGEEFLILLPEVEEDDALRVAERCLAATVALAIPHRGNPGIGHVSCSLGVATARPRPEDDPFSLVRAADDALYEAKHAGRCRVCVARR